MDTNWPWPSADALEVMFRHGTDCERCVEDQRANPVSAGDVVHAAFHLPTCEFLCDCFGHCFRVVIIAVFNNDDLD